MFVRTVVSPLQKLQIATLAAQRGGVMITDPDLNIVHANPSALQVLGEAEAELGRLRPGFTLASLVGSNLDLLYPQPDAQRRALLTIAQPHAVTVGIGPHRFDLLATPLEQAGQRLGFVLEWQDARPRLVKLELAAQVEAIGRSSAMISFDPQSNILDANLTFLAAMGYTLDEIRGRSHRIFMSPEDAGSAEYTLLWDSLRAGQFRAGRMRRIAKGAREVWIEASYNPIFDEKGQVVQVVKYATDVSAQAKLLVRLNEMMREVGATMEETRAAAGATAQAAASATRDILAAAAAGGEVARATQALASGMSRAREGTDAVFSQASGVTGNTDAMAEAARAMGGIVALIRSVASQINLLALNATIEASRAGDAGKGFAVVAGEVKNLAIQAAKATEQISSEIDGLQNLSSGVAQAVIAIRDAVGAVRNEVAEATMAARAETTRADDIRGQLEAAAMAVQGMAASMDDMSRLVSEVTASMVHTRDAAQALAA